MFRKHVVLMGILVQLAACAAFADRPLDRSEILQIFQKLTIQPRKTWIPAGTIEASHEQYRGPRTIDNSEINSQVNQAIQEYQSNPNKHELTAELQKMKLDAIPFNVRYKLSNEYTMNSTVTVKFDGNRFYWENTVNSRTDSVKPGANLEGNFMTEEFNLNWNARRLFAWDGQNYTTYALPGNQVIVDSTGSIPRLVNGPLTAGVIAWGYGNYSYQNLAAANSLAVEKYVDGQAQLHLTLAYSDGSEVVLVMEPAKGYAVISCSRTDKSNVVINKQYANYRLISSNWVPTTILIEQYDAGANKLLAYDLWNLARISGYVPTVDRFSVEYEPDALVEYFSYLTDKPLMYRYSYFVDTDLLLSERLAIAASEGLQLRNCATIAMKYALSQLGKDVTDQQLSQLISAPDRTTSLYAMKQFAQGLGLYGRAVKTDIPTLKSLYGCQAILHFPGKNHFVVLDHADNQYVWIIDLANNRFYYRTDLNFFGMDWTEGTALLHTNTR